MIPSTWGDEVVLLLTSNLLEVDIHVITFQDNSNNGVTIVKPIDIRSQRQPIYLFLYSETDFESAHYQSVLPSSLPSSSLPIEFEVSEVSSFDQDNLMSELEITEESIRDIQVVVTDRYKVHYLVHKYLMIEDRKENN